MGTATLSLEEIQREYLDDLRHRVTPAHYQNVELRLGRTFAALGVRAIEELQPLAVVRYRNRLLEEGFSNRSVNLVVDNLKTLFTWALENDLVETNPVRSIRRLPWGRDQQRCRRRALSEEEIKKFLRAAAEDDRQTARTWKRSGGGRGDHRRRATRVAQAPLWRAFLEVGARWSELTRVPWQDMDIEKRTILLRAENTKTKKSRVVPLTDALVEDLRRLLRVHVRVLGRPSRGEDPVFLTPEGARWSRPTNNAMRIFDRVLARAGIARVDHGGEKLDIHALRHTFGSRLARNGEGLVQVQRLMGHSDPKLTAQVYTHLGVEDLRGAIERMAVS